VDSDEKATTAGEGGDGKRDRLRMAVRHDGLGYRPFLDLITDPTLPLQMNVQHLACQTKEYTMYKYYIQHSIRMFSAKQIRSARFSSSLEEESLICCNYRAYSVACRIWCHPRVFWANSYYAVLLLVPGCIA
jgi:hypothetical protein